MVNDKDKTVDSLAGQLGLHRQELTELYLWNHLSEAEVRNLLELLISRLNALVGDDPENLAHWMTTHNLGLGAVPLELIHTTEGFRAVINYLNSFISR